MISYSKIFQKLNERRLTKTALVTELKIPMREVDKIERGERIDGSILEQIAQFLSCSKDELCRQLPDNAILLRLREEKSVHTLDNLYQELQVRMTYNSNRIEGGKLNEEQTRIMFKTNTLGAVEGIPVDDIIETVNHFRTIDYVIDIAEEPLTEDIIKELHRILKQGTGDSTLSWFVVGGYKMLANTVGGRETAQPNEIPDRMNDLIYRYESLDSVSVHDIIRFHYEFERIHPFQDGNGRVGRLIALKECLRHSIVPFLIEDSKKVFYYRGLAQWEYEEGYLTDTCLDGQDTFKRMLSTLDLR